MYPGGRRQTRHDLRRALQSSPVYAHLLQEPRPPSLKERRQHVKGALPGPIWEEFVAALRLAEKRQSIVILSPEEEVQILESILTSDFHDLYAKRPTDMSLLNNPSSASMTALRNLLNEVEDVSTLPAPKDDDDEEEVMKEEEQTHPWWATYDTNEEVWSGRTNSGRQFRQQLKQSRRSMEMLTARCTMGSARQSR